MTAPSAEIAVIVVNYGTAALAIEAVESVRARRHGSRTVDVHLVDNASPGDDAAHLAQTHRAREWGQAVTLWPEPVNHGFGRGNNVVLEALAARPAPPRYVFLLNPDARLENEAIAVLADFLDAHPQAGAAGAAIALPDGTSVTAAFRFPSILGEFEKTANFGPVARALGRWRVPMAEDLPTQPVDWVSGAAVMFRFEAMRAAGFFDPAYFLYFEETDLMRSLARRGWTTWTVAEARAVHEEGYATGVATATGRRRRPAYVYASFRHYFSKNHGRVYALAAAVAGLLGGALNRVISLLRGRTPWLPANYSRDVIRHVIGPLLWRRGPHGSDGGLSDEPVS